MKYISQTLLAIMLSILATTSVSAVLPHSDSLSDGVELKIVRPPLGDNPKPADTPPIDFDSLTDGKELQKVRTQLEDNPKLTNRFYLSRLQFHAQYGHITAAQFQKEISDLALEGNPKALKWYACNYRSIVPGFKDKTDEEIYSFIRTCPIPPKVQKNDIQETLYYLHMLESLGDAAFFLDRFNNLLAQRNTVAQVWYKICAAMQTAGAKYPRDSYRFYRSLKYHPEKVQALASS